MNKGLVKKFIEDKFCILTMYFLNVICLITFFNINGLKNIEILYPTAISLFLLILVMSIEFFKYYAFNLSLQEIYRDHQCKINTFTNEQKLVEATIRYIEKEYRDELIKQKNDFEKRSQFLSQWIHKLKVPISVIDLIIQKYSKETGCDKKLLNDIRTENESLFNCVEQLLTLLRLDKFESDYEVKGINIIGALKRSINDKKNQFIYNRVFPVINFSKEVEYVLTDYKWNEVMISQIISNAIKYSADKSRSKNVYFSIMSMGKYTVLTIKDEGVGIESHDLKRIFKPFFTGDNGRSYRNSSGIGLYICKSIAEKLGHDIKLESKPGEGTEVRISYLSKM
ncbi:histidine kinase [Clostridium zeae]|uniref:histidine kinase n=1 Tax=Clostridium zeae TaxID=2759022 RepID=A0ABQ1EAE6_9CLOT|nr:sensor histidine kinase [Clostridium zeae]GFZ31488.1 histidine kinase [Clostridium zeae]